MALIGYARVSTDEQTTDPQIDALKAAGCQNILREHGSGGDRARPGPHACSGSHHAGQLRRALAEGRIRHQRRPGGHGRDALHGPARAGR